MEAPHVWLVAETPSLAQSLSDLLETAGIDARVVGELESATPAEGPPEGISRTVAIVASRGPYCSTARRWRQGAYPDTELIVVGSRDPTLTNTPHMRLIELPLHPGELVDLVRSKLVARDEAWIAHAMNSSSSARAVVASRPLK